MKTTFFGLLLVAIAIMSVAATNNVAWGEDNAAKSTKTAFLSVGKIGPSRSAVTPVADRHWHFMGCARSHRHCHHLADHAGYHHATVRHDHDRCHHHPHLACYAWN